MVMDISHLCYYHYEYVYFNIICTKDLEIQNDEKDAIRVKKSGGGCVYGDWD